jgi:hypothetical protein
MDLFIVRSSIYKKVRKFYLREVCDPLGLDLHVKVTGSSLTDFMSSDSDQLGGDPEESCPDVT